MSVCMDGVWVWPNQESIWGQFHLAPQSCPTRPSDRVSTFDFKMSNFFGKYTVLIMKRLGNKDSHLTPKDQSPLEAAKHFPLEMWGMPPARTDLRSPATIVHASTLITVSWQSAVIRNPSLDSQNLSLSPSIVIVMCVPTTFSPTCLMKC